MEDVVFIQQKNTGNNLTGLFDGEKSAKNNENNYLISIYFNSELAILTTNKNAQKKSERFYS